MSVLEQVLDLYRYVECQMLMFTLRGFQQFEAVGGRVEEVGVAEGDVARAHGGLLVDVGEHAVGAVEPQASLEDGGERAVRAAVGAAARGLHVAGQLEPVFRAVVAGVLVERGQSGAIGRGAWGAIEARRARVFAARQGEQLAVGVAGQRPAGQTRCADAVEGQFLAVSVLAELAGERGSEPRGGVHGGGDADQVGPLVEGRIGGLDGEVERADIVPVGAEQCGGGGQPERLVALLVGGNQ